MSEYTAQLNHMNTPEIAGEIKAWADVLDVKPSQLIRELISAALPACRERWSLSAAAAAGMDTTAGETVELDAEFLAQHIAAARANHRWARARRGETGGGTRVRPVGGPSDSGR